MAATREMREVWCSRPFDNKCGGFVIDEAHAIIEMGTDAFRKAYQELRVLSRATTNAAGSSYWEVAKVLGS